MCKRQLGVQRLEHLQDVQHLLGVLWALSAVFGDFQVHLPLRHSEGEAASFSQICIFSEVYVICNYSGVSKIPFFSLTIGPALRNSLVLCFFHFFFFTCRPPLKDPPLGQGLARGWTGARTWPKIEKSRNSFFLKFWVDARWSTMSRISFAPKSTRFARIGPSLWPFFHLDFSLNALGWVFFCLKTALWSNGNAFLSNVMLHK